MWHANATFAAKQPPSRSLKEWELEDVVASLCHMDTFDGYGIKMRDGENVLAGAGLREEEAELKSGGASIQMGSETWKKRMAEECRKLINEELLEDASEDVGEGLMGVLLSSLCPVVIN